MLKTFFVELPNVTKFSVLKAFELRSGNERSIRKGFWKHSWHTGSIRGGRGLSVLFPNSPMALSHQNVWTSECFPKKILHVKWNSPYSITIRVDVGKDSFYSKSVRKVNGNETGYSISIRKGFGKYSGRIRRARRNHFPKYVPLFIPAIRNQNTKYCSGSIRKSIRFGVTGPL